MRCELLNSLGALDEKDEIIFIGLRALDEEDEILCLHLLKMFNIHELRAKLASAALAA